jgi:hypothetical protein
MDNVVQGLQMYAGCEPWPYRLQYSVACSALMHDPNNLPLAACDAAFHRPLPSVAAGL